MKCEIDNTDKLSVFEYEDGEPDSFNLDALSRVVERHFGIPCTLVKIAEGGFHKVSSQETFFKLLSNSGSWVYDVIGEGEELNAVARVASPAFPVDKMESEVFS